MISVLFTACDREDPRAPASEPAGDSAAVVAEPGVSSQTTIDLYGPGVNPDSVDDRTRFIVLGLRRLGHSVDDLIATLGPPDSLVSEPIQNRHVPSRTDSVVTAYFERARATVYRPTGGADLVVNITVYDDSLLRLNTVGIGMAWEDVVAAMGPPDDTGETDYRWSCTECAVDQQLVVEVADGRVASIGFEYYID